jgi:hypothetical protein
MMDTDQYLQMVESQLQEAKENMELAEKAYKESKAKYDGILSFMDAYKKWIGEKEHERTGL